MKKVLVIKYYFYKKKKEVKIQNCKLSLISPQ